MIETKECNLVSVSTMNTYNTEHNIYLFLSFCNKVKFISLYLISVLMDVKFKYRTAA